MKYIKILISIASFFLLVSCNDTDPSVVNSQEEDWNEEGEAFVEPEPIGTVLTPITDDMLAETLEQLERNLHLDITVDETIWKLVMRDLVTWEELATYALADGEHVSFSRELENGYFLVQISPLFWDEDTPELPFIIFDDNLTPVETIWFEGEVLPFPMEIVRLIDEQLYIYGWGWSGDWAEIDDWTLMDTEFLKVNIHTGEFEVLFVSEGETQNHSLHQFINETQILTSRLTTVEATGEFRTRIGILDIVLGEFVYEFELDNFAILDSDFQDSTVLFSESRIALGRERNEVLIFDTDNRVYQMVSLAASDENFFTESFRARLSLDGNHIVTINEGASVFRKYDVDGMLVAEVEIEIEAFNYYGFEIENNFEIFPLTDKIYAIHILHDLGRHIQMINLP